MVTGVIVWTAFWAAVCRRAGNYILYESRRNIAVGQADFGGNSELITHRRDYFEQVLALEQEIFGDDCVADGRLENCLQTNLYAAKPAVMDFLLANDFKLGVSYDFVPGVRLTAGGKETGTPEPESRQSRHEREFREFRRHDRCRQGAENPAAEHDLFRQRYDVRQVPGCEQKEGQQGGNRGNVTDLIATLDLAIWDLKAKAND